ncbi:hypothetical protein HS088_TW22G01005 [Tripterygium wilfordii]|uniref:UDP-glycosyltransferase 87A1-like n=1 Tax=Tripterygium wilfordii TaxID=458696 RepID=A0A7J7BZN2_TRIWF|nr:UDP-glycosyltransferase 87A2-like [Tripterygium wilfordii]KAF5727312.1 hypothetical protein HS088_TW22G01005 [Tripterygium wilfordii]
MDHMEERPITSVCHVVAMPFPGRGHINPMMNVCKLLASRNPATLITFVVTEEWLGYIGSDPKPANIRLASVPNVIPPERLKAADFSGFYEAVMTRIEAPFEELLDLLDPPAVSAILGDVELRWVIGVGNRRNIPVASVWTMSASLFSMLYHFDIFTQSRTRHSPLDLLANVNYVLGISPKHLSELKQIFLTNDHKVLKLLLECISMVPNAQYILLTCFHELESPIINSLKSTFSIPVYPIGPAIPYLDLQSQNSQNNPDYLKWLDSQPPDSVLYISLGSFLSVSSTQFDEILVGLQNSGVQFLWVARSEADRLRESCGDSGLVLSWCEQLKVLCHSSVSGFWTHCGWNSTLEAVFAGVPMLTFPLFLDQDSNSDQIVQEWRVGKWVKREEGKESLVSKEYVTELVQKFMDLESEVGKEMRGRARKLRETCLGAIAEGGSSSANLDEFIKGISGEHRPQALTSNTTVVG